MNSTTVSELNDLSVKLGIDNRVRFYGQDADAVKVVCAVAPYSRVAVLYAKTSFNEFGRAFTERLKLAGIKPLNFIMPENAALSIENVFDVIGVPDDVRAILFFDRELKDIAAYIATLFKIPVIFTLNTVNTDGVLSAKVPFFWGGKGEKTDFFPVDCVYHVILGGNALNCGDKAEQYIDVFGKITALADYRVRLWALDEKAEKPAYDVIKKAVISVFYPLPSAEKLLIAGLKTELANLASGGAIIYNSAEYCFKRIIGFKEIKGVKFAFFKKLLHLYALCAEHNDMPFVVPDYNKRVKELSEITKSDDGVFLDGLFNQVRILRAKGDTSVIKSGFKNEFKAQVEAFKTAEQNYVALNGETETDFSPFIEALKLCGDIAGTVNFMTVVRESGFAEFI